MDNKALAKVKFEKDKAALKFYCLGKGYSETLKVMAFAAKFHTGYRKDNITPEFHHQVRIAFSIINLRGIVNEERCLSLALAHDTAEDYNVSFAELAEKFGTSFAREVILLDKNQHGTEKLCMLAISNDENCSIVKGADNIDNVQSMHGAFTPAKISSYMARTEDKILPMLKQAAVNFPAQYLAYSSMRYRLKAQLELYRALITVSVGSPSGNELPTISVAL